MLCSSFSEQICSCTFRVHSLTILKWDCGWFGVGGGGGFIVKMFLFLFLGWNKWHKTSALICYLQCYFLFNTIQYTTAVYTHKQICAPNWDVNSQFIVRDRIMLSTVDGKLGPINIWRLLYIGGGGSDWKWRNLVFHQQLTAWCGP